MTCHVTIIKEAQEVPPNTLLTQAFKNPLRFISLSVLLPLPREKHVIHDLKQRRRRRPRERHLQSEFALPRTRLIRRMLANLFGVEF